MEEKSNYKSELEIKINQLEMPVSVTSCTDVSCKDPAHKEDLDRYTLELLEVVQEVAEKTVAVPAQGIML